MGKKKSTEAEGEQIAPASSPKGDTSFKIGDDEYDFNETHFTVPGIGVVNVKTLIEEDPEQFDAVCARLVEIGSGFIHKITE